MRVCVTGGAGFIGRHLVHQLSVSGHEVIVVDRAPWRPFRDLHRPARSVEMDVNDTGLPSLFAGVDVVFHLAATSQVMGYERDPAAGVRDNVNGHVSVLEAAVQAGVRKVLFTSSREVYGEAPDFPVPESAPARPINHYGLSKWIGERYLEMYAQTRGLKFTTVRLSNVYGEGDPNRRVVPIFVERAIQGLDLTVFGQEKVADFVYVDDVVEQMVVLGTPDQFIGTCVNIGSGAGTSLLTLARRISDSAGARINITVAESNDREVKRFIADTSLLQKLTGYRPPVDPLNRIPEMVHRWRETAW